MIHLNYIIVGQGIAGSVLAWELVQRRKKVLIFDPGNNNATKVASGIINPITGRNYVKTWMADEVIPFAVNFYQNLEKKFKTDFFKSIPVCKLFYSAGNQNEWSLRSGNPEYSSFLSDKNIILLDKSKVNNDFGAFGINNTYALNTIIFLTALENYFLEKETLIKASFDFDDLIIENNSIQYKEIRADKIIFCEGHLGKLNPFFNYLPFNPAKGESLHVKINNYYNDRIISGNYFTMPVGDDEYYLGSTNHWDFNNELPTEAGKNELTDGLKTLTPLPFSVNSHKAAIRPTVKDRKPLIGLHPANPRLCIFNGLGTKGISLAPWFASHFADFLEGDFPLLKEVNIERFLK